VRVLTFDRPEARNAMTAELQNDFLDALRAVAAGSSVRAIVLTGAGRTFSAGGDFDSIGLMLDDASERRASMADARRMVNELLAFPLPVIAAVNGPAVGLGCTIALLSDIVLMADHTFLADPHVTVGLVAGDGGAVTFPLLTSMVRAKEYLLTGRRIPAAEAERVGLVNRVVEPGALAADALALATEIAALPPQAVQDTKRTLNLHLQRAALDVLAYGLAAEAESYTTGELREIVERLRTPRPPA
jgi:enoyl-CoA hydratase